MRYVWLVYFRLRLHVAAADLPVREVVLYKHGVGYFARSGRLGAGESARLDFKAEEMNDVLKSLTVEEKGGGKISGLRYDSSEPLAKKLDEFPFAVGSQQPLSAVLDQLKGARIELKFGTETVAGAIVGARGWSGGAESAGARAGHAADGFRRTAQRRSRRRQLAALQRSEAAIAVQGLSRGAGAVALEGQAQRLHRFDRFESARDPGQLHDPDAGVEIELPADLRRERRSRRSKAGRLSTTRRAMTGRMCGWRWCRAGRFRLSAGCISRGTSRGRTRNWRRSRRSRRWWIRGRWMSEKERSAASRRRRRSSRRKPSRRCNGELKSDGGAEAVARLQPPAFAQS